ncbi:abscisate beta-glucosyltransferase-like [Pyrus ussuriensis x Pyrus communis]|uniref:Glycosyltransferase n=1 Tax=Pyrus ussuriensis x Pyrus communis TaxID=2448454 RepID=A0A5N5IBJ5_9ROSA|nr:abscisate beta-glucosyltransferase-like [Pyrus ussuriensis x Pyrus communis]
MDSSETPVVMYFFPFVGGGHQIPMIDMARVFSSHGAKVTILSTTPANALRFRNSIRRDQTLNRSITIHVLKLPDDDASADSSMTSAPLTDTSVLQESLRQFIAQNLPNCIVIDVFHRWAAEVIDELFIKRVVFNGNGLFSRCVSECIGRFAPHQNVGADCEPFLVPNLPDRIELTKSQLPSFARNRPGLPDKVGKVEEKSFGVVVNSFYELESKYVEYFTTELGKKAWPIGPVSLYNRSNADKTDRGQAALVDEQSVLHCLNWLDSKEPDSVVYISFGSLARLSAAQLVEIAHGIESSGHNFIWVMGKIFRAVEDGGCVRDKEDWIPAGFAERMWEMKRGVVIGGWAPQMLILEHCAVGVFVSHCGWNSTLESVSAGVPMVTWPLSAEQFYNEKLITDVLGIGVQVGSREWESWNVERKELVRREKVDAAVRRMMGGSDEAAEMKKRAKVLSEKAKRAVEEGGSSYVGVDALILEIRLSRKN